MNTIIQQVIYTQNAVICLIPFSIIPPANNAKILTSRAALVLCSVIKKKATTISSVLPRGSHTHHVAYYFLFTQKLPIFKEAAILALRDVIKLRRLHVNFLSPSENRIYGARDSLHPYEALRFFEKNTLILKL